jgi:phenylalanyl-tRNA synthetase beta chain
MRFSEAWLREWVDPPIGTEALAAQLSMSGLEVDAVEPVAPPFSGVVVGHVQSAEPHPNADKLRLCTVDAGQDAPLQIICGAANVAAGMRVPVAMIGAELPGGFKIKRAKLRGVESAGMICSSAELGLAETSSGIMPLPAGAPVGADLRDFLALDDHAIELDLTPDRADCLSIAGVARDIGVLNRVPVTGPNVAEVPPGNDERWPVELIADDACPRYACRVVRSINPAAETPLWMRERLRRSGLRPISPVVDVTNYVLLELGQPLHAFDLGKLDGAITVRMAADGEPLKLLNGDDIKLREDTLVIADAHRPVALAGIMGGAETGVEPDTTDILLESALFAPTAISGKARSYGLHTDSSHRFERGVDPALQARAIERATGLLLEIVGGTPGPVVDIQVEQKLPRPPVLALRRRRIGQVLGIEADDAAVEDILTRLGMRLAPADDGWLVSPPSSRFDCLLEVDLIAEIGRIHGYDNIPITHARSAATTRAPLETAFDLERARRTLVARGWHEIVTYSFVNPELQAEIEPEAPALALSNPISAELGVMRTGLWPGLIQAARQNLARQQPRVRLFESGLRFRLDEAGRLHQEEMLAGLAAGTALPEQWGESSRQLDFYDIKADVEAILALTGCSDAYSLAPARHAALHPGQTAEIVRDSDTVGRIGRLHPGLAKRFDITTTGCYLFELALDGLADGRKPSFEPLSKFPSIRRDIAIVVDADVPYADVANSVRAGAGDLLRELILFDRYQGDNIEEGRKSLALGLILQASSQTLTDTEVADLMERVLMRLADDVHARLRN